MSFGLSGVMGAMSLSMLVVYFVSLLPIRKYVSLKKGNFSELKQMVYFMMPTAVILLAINLYCSIDMILVKYFFSPEEAGMYGAISIIGRIIFFITGAIVTVMFPMLAKAKKEGNQHNLFIKSSMLVMLCAIATLAFYYFFPELVVKILVGSKYLEIAPYIVWFGLAMLMYSFVNIYSRYFLSNNNYSSLYIYVSGFVLQLLMLYYFHTSISQVIWMMNLSMGIILIALSTYYLYQKKSEGKLLNKSYG